MIDERRRGVDPSIRRMRVRPLSGGIGARSSSRASGTGARSCVSHGGGFGAELQLFPPSRDEWMGREAVAERFIAHARHAAGLYHQGAEAERTPPLGNMRVGGFALELSISLLCSPVPGVCYSSSGR